MPDRMIFKSTIHKIYRVSGEFATVKTVPNRILRAYYLMRQVILYRDEDGYWVVECPSLKGCLSQGKTREEALINIKEAILSAILLR